MTLLNSSFPTGTVDIGARSPINSQRADPELAYVLVVEDDDGVRRGDASPIRCVESYLKIRDPANSTVPDSVVLPLTSAMNAVFIVIQTHFMPRDGDIQTDLDRNDRKTLIEEWCRAEGWNVRR